MTIYPRDILAPTIPTTQTPDLAHLSHPVSRSEPAERVERRVMRVTAYTANGKQMNGKGITANGERAVEGRTIAAGKSIPFGAEIYIPEFGKKYTVTDRGGMIYGNRLDLFMDSRRDAMKFGVQYLEVFIKN